MDKPKLELIRLAKLNKQIQLLLRYRDTLELSRVDILSKQQLRDGINPYKPIVYGPDKLIIMVGLQQFILINLRGNRSITNLFRILIHEHKKIRIYEHKNATKYKTVSIINYNRLGPNYYFDSKINNSPNIIHNEHDIDVYINNLISKPSSFIRRHI